MSDTEFALPDVEPALLASAVRAVLTDHDTAARLPSVARLRIGATDVMAADAPTVSDAAREFQSLLEVGYLVASADGLVDSEREVLALLLEHATGAVVDRATLQLHFRDLDATVEALGRRERLGRVAAEFTDDIAREEAIGFAALVALADGKLDSAELEVLRELAAHFALSDDVVPAVVRSVMARVERKLRP